MRSSPQSGAKWAKAKKNAITHRDGVLLFSAFYFTHYSISSPN